jgi:hypothetical protein
MTRDDPAWQRAREKAAEAEIDRLIRENRHGGFYPDKIRRAFAAGWCDTSGRVADFLEPRAHQSEIDQ